MGLGRYDLDPGDAEPGYYAKAAIEFPLTQSTRKDGTIKKAYWSVTASARYDEVELAESNLDEFSGRLGIRVVFPSKRDKQRAACQRARRGLLDNGATEQQLLREKRPDECIEPDDGGGRTVSSTGKEGQGGESTSDDR